MAETLDDLIDKRGLPLGELAKLAGIDERALYKLRNGQVAKARPTTVAGLAAALKVSTERVRKALRAAGRS